MHTGARLMFVVKCKRNRQLQTLIIILKEEKNMAIEWVSERNVNDTISERK